MPGRMHPTEAPHCAIAASNKPRREVVTPIDGHEKAASVGGPFLLRILLFGPEKPAALGVAMRERPAFRSAFAKHPLKEMTFAQAYLLAQNATNWAAQAHHKWFWHGIPGAVY